MCKQRLCSQHDDIVSEVGGGWESGEVGTESQEGPQIEKPPQGALGRLPRAEQHQFREGKTVLVSIVAHLFAIVNSLSGDLSMQRP